ncbi:MAG: aminoacyl-tRNA hydrolase [Rickettsiales bacterium]|jgi:PTH1 family peptidyl-tRNA hydrolase|nr:aminoacyl-tRNA hydrolase [Rickettsiales bacterium]
MLLFVGIGNIGKKYENTKHNVGFMFIERIVKKYNFILESKKFHSRIWQGKIGMEKIVIIEPQTFVNESGKAVLETANFYKIPLQNIYVFHDDMDLSLGKVKYKVGGGSAGHNGIKNIDAMIGKEYHRIRIGIDKPEFKDDTVNYVLGKFEGEKKETIDNVIKKVVDNIEILFKDTSLFLTKIAN